MAGMTVYAVPQVLAEGTVRTGQISADIDSDAAFTSVTVALTPAEDAEKPMEIAEISLAGHMDVQ